MTPAVTLLYRLKTSKEKRRVTTDTLDRAGDVPIVRSPARQPYGPHVRALACTHQAPDVAIEYPVPVVYRRFSPPSPHEVARSTWGPGRHRRNRTKSSSTKLPKTTELHMPRSTELIPGQVRQFRVRKIATSAPPEGSQSEVVLKPSVTLGPPIFSRQGRIRHSTSRALSWIFPHGHVPG